MRKIGILTSGGDSPGMNAVIRSVVRTGIVVGLEVYGIQDGYRGLFQNNLAKLGEEHVRDLIGRGGTVLGTSRFPRFEEEQVRKIAVDNMLRLGITDLVVVGGDGSLAGMRKLQEMDFNCIGIPGTVDNDVCGTDYTVGYNTALESIVRSLDALRVTSSSHGRIFIVEVMGRYCDDLAIASTVAGGCEFVIQARAELKMDELADDLRSYLADGRDSAVVVVAEHKCDVNNLAKYVEGKTRRETRAVVLGHVQRGGSPTACDRILASKLGTYAVELLLEGRGGCCVGLRNGRLTYFDVMVARGKDLTRDDYLLRLIDPLYLRGTAGGSPRDLPPCRPPSVPPTRR